MVKSLSWVTVILWMVLIFYFSQQPVNVSNELSMSISEQIIDKVERVISLENVYIDYVNHTVRKNAHFFIYFLLGIFVLIALKSSGMKGFSCIYFAFLLCMTFAVSDETHQLFVDGRGGQIRDVLIDCTGAASGIIITSIFNSIVQNRKDQKVRSKQKAKKDVLEDF